MRPYGDIEEGLGEGEVVGDVEKDGLDVGGAVDFDEFALILVIFNDGEGFFFINVQAMKDGLGVIV